LPLKVLIVEDSTTTRAMIASAIEVIDDLEIFESKSGFEALKLLPHHAFNLILTDINMPDINGLELVNFVKKNPDYKHIPLIIITTEGSKRDKEKGRPLQPGGGKTGRRGRRKQGGVRVRSLLGDLVRQN